MPKTDQIIEPIEVGLEGVAGKLITGGVEVTIEKIKTTIIKITR